jgi:hypothetical protein
VLARGPRNVYYRRAVPPAGVGGPFQSPGSREPYLLEYLAAWNNRGAVDAEIIFASRVLVQWVNAAAMSREVEARLDAQVGSIRTFVAAAKKNGAQDVAGMRLRIVPILKDERRSATTPLPAVAPREFTLE